MRQNNTRGRGARRGTRPVADRGRDDSPYGDRPTRQLRQAHPGGRPDERGDHRGEGTERGSGGRGRPRRKKRRVLRWFAISLAVLILGTSGAAYLYYEHLNGNLGKDALNLGSNKLDKADPNAKGQTPLNILLLGSDSRASKENVKLGGSKGDATRKPLADVQMLLHVSADRSNMSVISVPRDTKATIPKCTDSDDGKVYPKTSDKINTSLQHGGPGCTVATWEEMTGVPIDHFMMIDFSGVVSMADAVGGVPVCVNQNVSDPKSHLKLKKGESTIQGEMALSWLRTRHGFGDGTDIGRAKAQHMYMNSMVRQLKAGTKLSDPGKMKNLAEAATKALTVDDGLGSVKKLYDLGNDLKRVPTKRITMATMPWEYSGDFVVPKRGDSDQIFSQVRNDVALDGKDKKKAEASKKAQPSEPSQPKGEVAVRVMNGTGTSLQPPVSGRASVIANELARKGYEQATADQTAKSQADTTISYPRADQRGNALAVAKAMGVPERLVKHSSAATEVTLVVGADWRENNTYPKGSKGHGKGDNKAPDSADALNGDDKKACMKVNPNYTW